MANFKRNDESVKNKTFSSGPIKTTGIHKGHFTKAYIRKSKVPGAQSEAIHFDFVSTGGGYGSFDIWYQDKQGGKLDRSIAQIHELMALLNIDDLKEKKNDLIDMYDFDLKAVKQVRVDSYPQLINKYIGTVWQAEEYIKQVASLNEDGDQVWIDTNPPEIRERAVFLEFCYAETHASGGEFLNGDEPVVIDKFVEGLPEIKRVNVSNSAARDGAIVSKAQGQPAAKTHMPAPPADFDEFDDDIPFN